MFAGVAETAVPEHLLFSIDEDWHVDCDEEQSDY